MGRMYRLLGPRLGVDHPEAWDQQWGDEASYLRSLGCIDAIEKTVDNFYENTFSVLSLRSGRAVDPAPNADHRSRLRIDTMQLMMMMVVMVIMVVVIMMVMMMMLMLMMIVVMTMMP